MRALAGLLLALALLPSPAWAVLAQDTGASTPNKIRVVPPESLQAAFNRTAPRLVINGQVPLTNSNASCIGAGNPIACCTGPGTGTCIPDGAQLVAVPATDVAVRALAPTEGVGGDDFCFEGDRVGGVSGGFQLQAVTSDAGYSLDRAGQTVIASSELFNAEQVPATSIVAVRSSYDQVCIPRASGGKAAGDAPLFLVLTTDAIYRQGDAACVGNANPAECCTGSGTGRCVGYHIGNDSCVGSGDPDPCCTGAGTGTCVQAALRLVSTGGNKAPCASWSYASGAEPGTHASNCQRYESTDTSTAWSNAQPDVFAMAWGNRQTVSIGAGTFSEAVDLYNRGLLAIECEGEVTWRNTPLSPGDFTSPAYNLFVKNSLDVSLEGCRLRTSGVWTNDDHAKNIHIPLNVHYEGSSQIAILGNDMDGGVVAIDGAVGEGVTDAGEANRWQRVKWNKIRGTAVGGATRQEQLSRLISENNEFYATLGGNDRCVEAFVVGWLCGGHNFDPSTDAECISRNDTTRVTAHIADPSPGGQNCTAAVGYYVSADFHGYAGVFSHDARVDVVGDSGGLLVPRAFWVGEAGAAVGIQTQSDVFVDGGSFIVNAYDESAGPVVAVGGQNFTGATLSGSRVVATCPNCSAANVAAFATVTTGTLTVENPVGDTSDYLDLGGTFVAHPAKASATATAGGGAGITMPNPGCEVGAVVQCSSDAAACDVTEEVVLSHGVVTMDQSAGCTGSHTIKCICN